MAKKLTLEEWIEKANKIHNNEYDYSKVVYENARSKVKIICKKHGEFEQIANNHIQGAKCHKCAIESSIKLQSKTTEQFINEAKSVHGDKYDYSKVNYINNKEKVEIICKKHGIFKQSPISHLSGSGCPLCAFNLKTDNHRLTTEKFVKRAKNVHGDEFDYSNVEYVNNSTNVKIICKIHGEFEQTPSNHLIGHGCPICKSSKMEDDMFKFLTENNIKFEYQKRFDWLNKMSLDFYLPKHKVAIECQGLQHFQPIDKWIDEMTFNKIKERDEMKKKLCDEHNIKLLYYSNLHINYQYNVFENKNELLNEIKE